MTKCSFIFHFAPQKDEMKGGVTSVRSIQNGPRLNRNPSGCTQLADKGSRNLRMRRMATRRRTKGRGLTSLFDEKRKENSPREV